MEYLSICTPKEGFAAAYFDPEPLCPVWHGGRDYDIFHRSFPGIISIYCSPMVPASNRCREVTRIKTKQNKTEFIFTNGFSRISVSGCCGIKCTRIHSFRVQSQAKNSVSDFFGEESPYPSQETGWEVFCAPSLRVGRMGRIKLSQVSRFGLIFHGIKPTPQVVYCTPAQPTHTYSWQFNSECLS